MFSGSINTYDVNNNEIMVNMASAIKAQNVYYLNFAKLDFQDSGRTWKVRVNRPYINFYDGRTYKGYSWPNITINHSYVNILTKGIQVVLTCVTSHENLSKDSLPSFRPAPPPSGRLRQRSPRDESFALRQEEEPPAAG